MYNYLIIYITSYLSVCGGIWLQYFPLYVSFFGTAACCAVSARYATLIFAAMVRTRKRFLASQTPVLPRFIVLVKLRFKLNQTKQ